MDNTALELNLVEATSTGDELDTKEKIHSTETDELVIALCGPLGSPLKRTASEFKNILEKSYGYDCEIIKLSNVIAEYSALNRNELSGYSEIHTLIDKGDELRKKHGNGILAELAISKISERRESHKQQTATGEKIVPKRVCHIVDSIKNHEELTRLKSIYRDLFVLVSVSATNESRVQVLKGKDLSDVEISKLIDRDSGEDIPNGQTVEKTFPEADFFISHETGTEKEIEEKVKRFLDLLLQSELVTPSPEETAMYMANSAAANSACLSRQVGACILSESEDVLSVGWNDVPKFGGGLYGTDPRNDSRCYNILEGQCHNDKHKDKLANILAQEIIDSGLIANKSKLKLVGSLRNSKKLKGLIEFSRSIHAEMHAILNAGANQSGNLSQARLFCTTYPCHSCARHIVAAGIKEIQYIEPYKKSLALALHGDVLSEAINNTAEKVKIIPFEGVAPSKYIELFKVPQNSRKSNGKHIKIVNTEARPFHNQTLEALPALEGIVVKELLKKNVLPRDSDNEK